jgi:hypothetical protein
MTQINKSVFNFSPTSPTETHNKIDGSLPIEFLKKMNQGKWDRLLNNDKQINAFAV